jgi:hypothetical protein
VVASECPRIANAQASKRFPKGERSTFQDCRFFEFLSAKLRSVFSISATVLAMRS